MLLATHATLSFGSPEQKAQIIRNLIQQVGMDPAKIGTGDAQPYDNRMQELLSRQTSMQRNPNQTLAECYDAAVWANPITRAKEAERLATDKAQRLAAEATDRAKRARKATSANVTSNQTRSRVQDGAADQSLDDILKDTLAEIRSREA